MDAIELREAMAEALQPDRPPSAETLNLACFWMSRSLDELGLSNREAAALARSLLRAAGRTLIDAAGPQADPAGWAGTREQVLMWIDEALRRLGYEVRPQPDSGRPELPDPARDWS